MADQVAAGRPAVVVLEGEAGIGNSLGAYDELLGRIAEHHGDTVAAREWWLGARRQGRLVGSPHQVALAESHLARVPEDEAVRPRRKRSTTPPPPEPGPAAASA